MPGVNWITPPHPRVSLPARAMLRLYDRYSFEDTEVMVLKETPRTYVIQALQEMWRPSGHGGKLPAGGTAPVSKFSITFIKGST